VLKLTIQNCVCDISEFLSVPCNCFECKMWCYSWNGHC